METKRLIIRRILPTDWANLFEYLSDEEVVRYEPYPPVDEELSKNWAKQMSESNDFWGICLAESGKLIGQVYLAAKEHSNWEVGYVFNRSYHGHGFATEAVSALVNHAFQNQNAHRIYANCNPVNERSWKLLERIGFRREGHLLQNVYFKHDALNNPVWQDTYIYGLLANESL